MNAVDRTIRAHIYRHFRDSGWPPVVEEVMTRFGLTRDQALEAFARLEASRDLVLLPGTQRILMAHPFSAIATPFRVATDRGRDYFANCAWDAVALHLTLDQPVRVASFCHHCGEPIAIALARRRVESAEPGDPLVYLALPVAAWWQDIVTTCSNTMLFFASRRHLDDWLGANDESRPGEALDIAAAIDLALPLYATRMNADFARPTATETAAHFARLGLTGPFWKI